MKYFKLAAFLILINSSIHSRTDLSNASKFYYLVTQLKGEAASLMARFNHTNAEYIEAISLLQSTYGKPRKQIESKTTCYIRLSKSQANF